jgi:hypothetical protein
MNMRHALRLPLALALIAIGGIIGMLILDGAGDVASLILAALPLLVGGWALVRQRERIEP